MHLTVLAKLLTIPGSNLFLHHLVESARIENDRDIENEIQIMFVKGQWWIELFWSVLFQFQMARQSYVPVPLDKK